MTTSLCTQLSCPFNDAKDGCRRFAVSSHCRVYYSPNSSEPNPLIESNDYWLFQVEGQQLDLEQLRKVLQDEVVNKAEGQRLLKRQEELYGEGFTEFVKNGGSFRDWKKNHVKCTSTLL